MSLWHINTAYINWQNPLEPIRMYAANYMMPHDAYIHPFTKSLINGDWLLTKLNNHKWN